MLVARLLVQHEALRNALQDRAEIFLLPEVDPDLCAFNKDLFEAAKGPANRVLLEIRIEESGEYRLQPYVASTPALTYAVA